MKKLCNILISSLICGLLLIGHTNAMTYVVEGNSTKIEIQKSKLTNQNKINRGIEGEGDIIFSEESDDCAQENILGEYFILCEKTYSDGLNTHTVVISNTADKKFDTIYLNGANIKSITNFEGFNKIGTLRLDDNPNITLQTNTFNGVSQLSTLVLSNNNLTTFSPDVYRLYTTEVNNIQLKNNAYITIPDNIRNKRNYYKITLSDNIHYGNKSYEINLSDNPINFIKIIEPSYPGDDSSYNFEWFGYSYEYPDGTTYEYTLKKDGNHYESGSIANSQITINNFRDGYYEFKVCLENVTADENIKCDTLYFTNKLTGTLKLSRTPAGNPSTPITQKDINFSWILSGYPSDYASSYDYSIKKIGGGTINGSTTSTSTGFDITKLFSDYNGDYTFTVTLKNTDGEIGATASTGFKVGINSSLNITKPTESTITVNNVTSTGVTFGREGNSVLLNKYHYTLTGKNNQVLINETENRTEFTHTLGVGEYTLHVEMLDSNGEKIAGAEASKTIEINIPSTLEITSPISGSTVGLAKTIFLWEGFTPHTLNNYVYTLRNSTVTITGGTTNNTGFEYLNLSDGEYTLDVTMNYNDGSNQTKSASSKFTVNSNSGMYLNITTPTEGNHIYNNVTGVDITFSWNGGGTTRFSGYEYTLKKGSEIIKSGITKNLESGSFHHILPSGTYKLHVDMLDSENNSIIDKERDFSIIIPPSLTIDKPTPGLQNSKDIEFNWTGFAEFFDHYQYTLSGWNGSTVKTGQNNVSKDNNYFKIDNLHHGQYRFTVNIISTTGSVITGNFVEFSIFDDVGLATQISQDDTPISDNTLRSRTGTFSWYGQSEDFSGYYYSMTGTTFTGLEYIYTGVEFGNTSGSITLSDLSTGKYKFMVIMLSGPDKDADIITGKTIDFNVAIPASLTIISPSEGATIQSSTATVSWTGYNDTEPLYSYMIKKGSTVLDTSNLTDNTSFTRSDLSDGNYSVTVYMLSGWSEVATKTVNFTVSIPVVKSSGGGSSSKSHPTNNLKLSIGNDSPSSNEWIELIVKIDEKYIGKVTFPKIQYYSGSKWVDIPVTSKNYISDYSDDAKLGYVKFSSDDSGEKVLSQFIKFSRNGHYRIYAEDKDGYDTYVQLQIGPKKVEVNTGEVHNVADTEEEIYIARSCKKYTIIYSDTLNIYTSPNLNISEFFMNKDYLKRYLDSKNRRQSGCPTNVGWISTSYLDRTNDDERYTAPNGKVYFIVGEEGDYYSNELNRELKTPTSFRSIQELKYYIRDRNPLINMAALGPVN